MQQFLKESVHTHTIETPKTMQAQSAWLFPAGKPWLLIVNSSRLALSPRGGRMLGTKKRDVRGRTDGRSAVLILPENHRSAITKIWKTFENLSLTTTHINPETRERVIVKRNKLDPNNSKSFSIGFSIDHLAHSEEKLIYKIFAL